MTKITEFIQKWPQYRKALGAFVGSLIASLAGLLALGVLDVRLTGYIQAALAVLIPIGGLLGAARTKKNDPKPGEAGIALLELLVIVAWSAVCMLVWAYLSPTGGALLAALGLSVALVRFLVDERREQRHADDAFWRSLRERI